jgi:hypothetical protein
VPGGVFGGVDSVLRKEVIMMKGSISCVSWMRVLTLTLAILGPVSMIAAALILTLSEGWWFNLFLMYLAVVAMITVPTYVAVVTLLDAFVRQKAGKVGELRFDKVLHASLTITALACLASSAFLWLILFDVLHGGWAMPHFIFGGMLIVLWSVRGIGHLVGCAVCRKA